MKGEIIRVERMLADLKKYSEVAFENSRLVDAVIRNAVPSTYYDDKNKYKGEGNTLNEIQTRAIEEALSVN